MEFTYFENSTEMGKEDMDALASITIDGFPPDEDKEGGVVAEVILTKRRSIVVSWHHNGYRGNKQVQELIEDSRAKLIQYWDDFIKLEMQPACSCGCTEFIGHQVVYVDILVDNEGNIIENYPDDPSAIYDSNPAYGPFTCSRCGKEYESLSKLPRKVSRIQKAFDEIDKTIQEAVSEGNSYYPE